MTAMDEYHDIIEQLKPQRNICASARLRRLVSDASVCRRRTVGKSRWRWWTAAACLALILGTILPFKTSTTPSADNSHCVVYVAGQMVTGGEAQSIAEADVARMEQFLRTVEQQNSSEEEKVNQFIKHKSLLK